MAELYWRALARDVPFERFDSDETILAASDDLKRFSLFAGVDAGGVFRGGFMGDLDGPFVSQFLWRDVTYGPQLIVQQSQIPTPGAAYMTEWQEWLAAQNGVPPVGQPPLSNERRYIVTGRDLSGYVFSDFSYQAYLSAALLLLGMGAPFDPALPYPTASEAGFATFGGPHALDMLGRLTCVALKSAWFQKWLVHRRLRPEAFGGRVHARLARGANYPIHEALLGSDGLTRARSEHGSWLLPMAYIGGCPCHPAYPAGHAVIAGACVTALKAFFDESWVIEEPLVPDGDGKTLVPYQGVDLTVGGELNKLASNVSLGRDWAGIHWRSDGMEGMLLGERLAIALLRESRALYNEPFEGFALTTFNGESVVI